MGVLLITPHCYIHSHTCLRCSQQLRLAQRGIVYASAFGLNSHTGSAYPVIIQNKNLWITPNHIANIAKPTKKNTLTIKSEQINTTGQAKCASATTNTAFLNMHTVYTCVIVDPVVLFCNETCWHLLHKQFLIGFVSTPKPSLSHQHEVWFFTNMSQQLQMTNDQDTEQSAAESDLNS